MPPTVCVVPGGDYPLGDPQPPGAGVMRGGSWFDPPQMAHPAQRAHYLPGSRARDIGFRLARSL
jgi:formylglycine-generating enzyme required for sulfatase activity